jgi:exodeoxyribonuclease VII large subunit
MSVGARDSLRALAGPATDSKPASQTRPKALSVTELTKRIKGTLEGQFGTVLVEGELSNVSQPASGHLYFTIKDANAQISAVMFRGNQRGMTFRPTDGMLVRAFGSISVYERRGNYQILIRRMEEGGKGSLQAQFEALKQKLQKEGLFAQDRKQPLPMLPQHVGIVTSASGAAIQDILNVVTRRFPNLHVLLAPATVQGAGAAAEIAAAIDRLNAIGGLDVLIVGRGGGSLEDLWCFNEEVVARAIARSAIPVISAVGHEVDFTISDFVADLRAPTPSAAAELVVGCKDAFQARLGELQTGLIRALRERTLAARNRLMRASGSYVFREPANAALRHRQKLSTLQLRTEHSLRGAVQDMQQTVDLIGVRMQQQLRAAVQDSRQTLDDVKLRMAHRAKLCHQMGVQDVRRYETQLRALNPLAVLQRGYSVTRGPDGRIIVKVEDVCKGDTVVTQVAGGRFESQVLGVCGEAGGSES